MIIWRGMGLAILGIFAICYFATKYLFAEALRASALHYGVAFIVAALLILFTIKKRERDIRKLFESGNQEKIEKYRKAIEANPAMDMDNSALFFIDFIYWPYILGGVGLLCLIGHFVM